MDKVDRSVIEHQHSVEDTIKAALLPHNHPQVPNEKIEARVDRTQKFTPYNTYRKYEAMSARENGPKSRQVSGKCAILIFAGL